MSTIYYCAGCDQPYCVECDGGEDSCAVCQRGPFCDDCAAEHMQGHAEEKAEEAEHPCGRCGKGEAAGAAGLCEECNRLADEQALNLCECGEPLDLDGYDGRCGNCADRVADERERERGED